MKADARIKKELREYASLDDDSIEERISTGLVDFKAGNRQCDVIDMCVGLVNSYRGVLWRGGRSLANGDQTGWRDIVTFSSMCVAAYTIRGIHTFTAADATAPAALLVSATENYRNDLRQCLDKNREDAEEAHVQYFAYWYLSGGVLLKSAPKGPLRDLARVGLDKTLPEKLLTEACEFQISNMGVRDDDGVEFVNFELIPVWWYALKKLRDERGLATPRPVHPLFDTPLSQFPDPMPEFDPKSDENFNRILAIVESKAKETKPTKGKGRKPPGKAPSKKTKRTSKS